MFLVFPLLILTISTLLLYFSYKLKANEKIDTLTSDLLKANDEKTKLEIKYNRIVSEVKKQEDLKRSKDLDEMQLLFTKVNMLDDKITFFNTNFKSQLEIISSLLENNISKSMSIASTPAVDVREEMADQFQEFEDKKEKITENKVIEDDIIKDTTTQAQMDLETSDIQSVESIKVENADSTNIKPIEEELVEAQLTEIQVDDMQDNQQEVEQPDNVQNKNIETTVEINAQPSEPTENDITTITTENGNGDEDEAFDESLDIADSFNEDDTINKDLNINSSDSASTINVVENKVVESSPMDKKEEIILNSNNDSDDIFNESNELPAIDANEEVLEEDLSADSIVDGSAKETINPATESVILQEDSKKETVEISAVPNKENDAAKSDNITNNEDILSLNNRSEDASDGIIISEHNNETDITNAAVNKTSIDENQGIEITSNVSENNIQETNANEKSLDHEEPIKTDMVLNNQNSLNNLNSQKIATNNEEHSIDNINKNQTPIKIEVRTTNNVQSPNEYDEDEAIFDNSAALDIDILDKEFGDDNQELSNDNIAMDRALNGGNNITEDAEINSALKELDSINFDLTDEENKENTTGTITAQNNLNNSATTTMNTALDNNIDNEINFDGELDDMENVAETVNMQNIEEHYKNETETSLEPLIDETIIDDNADSINEDFLNSNVPARETTNDTVSFDIKESIEKLKAQLSENKDNKNE